MAADDYAKPKERIAKPKEGASCANYRGTCEGAAQREEMVGPEEGKGRSEQAWPAMVNQGGQLGDEKGKNKDAQNSPRAYDAETLISHMKTLSVTDGSECWVS